MGQILILMQFCWNILYQDDSSVGVSDACVKTVDTPTSSSSSGTDSMEKDDETGGVNSHG